MTKTSTAWQSDRLDGLGFKALEDRYAAPTREQVMRLRCSDAELLQLVAERIGPLLAHQLDRLSPDEVAVLARLERSSW